MTEDQQVDPSIEEDTNEQYFASDYDTDEDKLYAAYFYDSDDSNNDILTRDTYHQETQTLSYTRGINRNNNASPRQLQATSQQTFPHTILEGINYTKVSTQVAEMSTPEQLQQQLADALTEISNLRVAAAAAAVAAEPSNSSDALAAANAKIEEL